jgi:MarR-like DNA-binding transcriptional regulator SgrR of sgrS sRNA
MQRSDLRFLAAISLLTFAAPADAVARPRYGGMLRIEMQAAVRSLDPSEWPTDATEAAAKEKLAALVFERLVELDAKGRPGPSLALSWQHDPAQKQWQFRLRSGVEFHDGSPLTPLMVAKALGAANKGWRASPSGEGIVIRFARPMPGLLMDLADIRRAIFVRGADGSLFGTGPFRIAEWEPGRRAILTANDKYWRGRPFVDAVTVQIARKTRDQLLDLELDRADLVEIRPDEVRRATQRGTKIWSSAPLELLALVFERGRPTAEHAGLREAVALSIDRTAIRNVLFQKQGEPAGGLLPQWLSGYAFLFSTARDTDRARRIASSLPASVKRISLAYDASDPLARVVAERIAVNVPEAGLRLEVSGRQAATQPGGADLRLVRLRIRRMHPAMALADLSQSRQLSESVTVSDRTALEALYAAERALVEGYRVIPLLHLPELYAVSARVKTWVRPAVLPSGAWQLEDVWLEAEK